MASSPRPKSKRSVLPETALDPRDPLPDVTAQLLRLSLGLTRATALAGATFGALLVLAHLRSHSDATANACIWWLILATLMFMRISLCQRMLIQGGPLRRSMAARVALLAALEGTVWAAGLIVLVPPTPASALVMLIISIAVVFVFLVGHGIAGRPFVLSSGLLFFGQSAFIFVRDLPMPDVLCLTVIGAQIAAACAAWRARIAVADRLFLQRAAEQSARAQEAAGAELNRSREQIRLALDAIDAGVADTNLISGDRFFSTRYAELLGYRQRETFLTEHRFSQSLHAEDRVRVLAARAAHIDSGVPFRERCRLRRADGGYLWVQLRGESVRGTDGRATRLVVSVVDISAQHEAELRIAESERRYRALVDASPSLIWTCDARGYLTFVSHRACRSLYGLEPGEVLGRHVAEFSASSVGRLSLLRRFAPALRGQAVHDVVVTHRGGDDRIVHVAVSVLPSRGPNGKVVSMLGVCSDITALKRREADLHIALRNQQAIFDAAGEGIAFVRAGRIETVNSALAKMLGVQRDELIGRAASQWLFQVAQWDDIERAAREAALRQDATMHELLLRARDGRSVWSQLTARQLEPGTLIIVVTDITMLKRREALAWHQAHHDELTGLPNRRSLLDRAQRLLTGVADQNGLAALLVLDLDGFKETNDVFGHAFGDALLKRVALRLATVLRDRDVLARTGGDEFVILLPDVQRLAEVEMIAQKLVVAAGEDLESAGRLLPIRASIGVALYPEDGSAFQELLIRADGAMYAAKAAGRNRFYMARDLPSQPQAARA